MHATLARAVIGILLVGLVLLVFAATGCVLALLLGVHPLSNFVLASYVLAFAEIVALALLLSLFDALSDTALALGSMVIFAGACGAALLVGVPRSGLPPRPRAFRAAVGTGPTLALTVVVGLALAYVVVLVVGTPPNGWDPLNYHLARAGLWLEAGQVGYIDAAYDERLNFNPPNAEIAAASLTGIARHENAAAIAQMAAAVACSLGVFCLGRRVGLDPRSSFFGAVLFLAMPIVLLQSSTAKNDVVVASFLMAAAVFVIGRSRAQLVLVGVATALAVGVKFTAAYGVVLLLLLAVAAEPRGAVWKRLAAIAAGTIAGSYWYGVNAIESGRLLGDQRNVPGLTAVLAGPENLVTTFGLLVDFVDLSGAVGNDLYVFAVVATFLAAGILFATRRGRGALVAGGLVLLALPLYVLVTRVGRPALVRLHETLGSPQAYLAEGDPIASSPTTASDTASWFGPAGFVLVVGVSVVGIVLVRRGELPRFALISAGAPILWLVLLAATLTYHPWQGRFFVFPVALSASLWGLVLRAPAVAWGLTALAGTTAALSLVHFVEKPSGVQLLERRAAPSVWDMSRAEVQALHDEPLMPLLDYVERTIPAHSSVALALGANEFGYPFFDAALERRVVLVPWGSTGADLDSKWLVANPERATGIDRACWEPRFETERGTVFARSGAACAA